MTDLPKCGEWYSERCSLSARCTGQYDCDEGQKLELILASERLAERHMRSQGFTNRVVVNRSVSVEGGQMCVTSEWLFGKEEAQAKATTEMIEALNLSAEERSVLESVGLA